MAQQQALEERTPTQLSPLLQHQVRHSVLSRRRARGETDDIKVEFNEPKQYELTEEEKMKKERRKKQNREAAQRCRLKKKFGQTGPNQKLKNLESSNAQLRSEIATLKNELKHLQCVLGNHEESGQCVIRMSKGMAHAHCDYTTTYANDSFTSILQDGFQQVQYNVADQQDVPMRNPTEPLTYNGQGTHSQLPPYSPVSDVSCHSPTLDHQKTVGTGQSELQEESSQNLEQYLLANMNSNDSLSEQSCSAGFVRTEWPTEPTCPIISGTDRWLHQEHDVNRNTPDEVQDDQMSLYPAPFPSANFKPGPEVTSNGDIGIPSLDGIQLQELVTTQLFLSPLAKISNNQQ